MPGVLDFNGYYDTRDMVVFTINAAASLPARFQYSSFVNYVGVPGGASRADLASFYSEQNLRFSPFEAAPIDLAAQLAIQSGAEGNDILRTGVRLRAHNVPILSSWLEAIGLSYCVSVFPFQIDHEPRSGWRSQVEHVYRWDPIADRIDRRLYFSGFVDHNLWMGAPSEIASSRFVTEHQIGLRLWGSLYVVAEWRLNQLAATKRQGIGVGLEFSIPLETRL